MAFNEAIEGGLALAKELAKEGPFADFAKGLFGPDLFETKVSAAADGAASGSEAADSYEVAELRPAAVISPDEWQGSNEGYLRYLLDRVIPEDRAAATSIDDGKRLIHYADSDRGDGAGSATADAERAYDRLESSIRSELRFGGEVTSGEVDDFYNRLMGIRATFFSDARV